MAHVEPMDIDGMESDYEDKENSILRSNVLQKIPFTEKGHEELDVSELNMKLRYSITPASSPMSRSYTANCKDDKDIEDKNSSVNNIGNSDLTSSLNSTLTNNDINKVSKVYPLQALPTDNLNDTNRNVLIPKSLVIEDNNVTISVCDNIDNFSIASTSSSVPHTPEATTPTKELPKDGGSPIMRGLRSVLSMFKPQSPQPSQELPSHEFSSQADCGLLQTSTITCETELHPVQVSTPLRTTNRISPKRTSPHRETLVFNDDLEKELHWNDDSTILFKEEKIPKHKLFLQETITSNLESKILNKTKEENNKTLEYMDISYNDTVVNDKTMTDVETEPCAVIEAGVLESDGEFVDCEPTYTKHEIESLEKSNENMHHNSVQNISMSVGGSTSSDLMSPAESMNLNEKNVAISNISPNEISGNDNSDSQNILQETLSINHTKDISLCETELPIDFDVNASDTSCSSYNVTDTVQSIKEQIGDKTNVSHINEMYPDLDKIGNVLKSKEKIIDEIDHSKLLIPIKEDNVKIESEQVNSIEFLKSVQDFPSEDAKSNEAVCGNILTNDIIPILSSVNNQIQCNTINKEAVELVSSKADDDLNTKNKTSKESNKENMEVMDSLMQTSNNSCETVEINVCDKVPSNSCRDTLSQNKNVCSKDCVVSANKIHSSKNERHELYTAEIILPHSELKNKMPVDIPLPTDSDIDDICVANKISSNKENEVNEVVEMNATRGLHKMISEVSSVIEIPILKTVDKDVDHFNEPKSAEEINDIRRSTTFDEDNSFEIIEKEQEINKSVVPESDENNSKKNIEPMNDNPTNVINEEPETFNNDSSHLTNLSETFKMYAKDVSKNDFSLPCDTDDIKNVNEKVGQNMEQTLSNSFEINNKLQISPPLSPSKSNRGYNIDFDNIENPFATKTKIRQSPTPELPGQVSPAMEDKTQNLSVKLNKPSKRKSYPVRKPINTKKNSLNSTFEDSIKKDCKSNFRNYDTTVVNIEKESFVNDTSVVPNIVNKSDYKTDLDVVNVKKDSSSLTDASCLPNTINTSVNKPDIDMDTTSEGNIKTDLSFTADASNLPNTIDKSVNKLDLDVDTTSNGNIKTDLPFTANASGLQNTVNNSVFEANMGIENKRIFIINDKNENKIHDEHLFSDTAEQYLARDVTKSVFNCPEINDINFCSFSDKQKSISSDLVVPPGDITIDDAKCLNPKKESVESIYSDVIDKQVPNETSVSKDSKNSDIKEVNTEDEDTATFNETSEFIENDKENTSNVKDMLAFEVSHTADSDNVDNGEMFIDAEAFEFLLNQNKSSVIADSGKESLFLKFDPLFTKRVSSDGIIAALKRVQNNQSTPKKITKMQLETACEMPGSSQKETDDFTDDTSIQAMSKPMMVVNPAVNSIASPKKPATPKVNRQSLTFTSPAMAVIDKLLSLSGNSIIADHNTPASSPISSHRHNETDIAITQLREMLADKDIHVHNLRSESKELKDRLCSLETQVKSLEIESSERLKKVNDLNERLLEKTKMNKSMANVVEEYERTIASLIAQIEQDKKNNAEEKIMLTKERDEQTAHLASMEVSFNDLHSKYEKSKQLIYSMKANEETYKKSIQEFEESLAKMQNNYELLKQHATSKLNHANLELEKFNRAHEAEVLKLNALIKRKELHITSLEETLAQKTKANEELTAICDELINKVG